MMAGFVEPGPYSAWLRVASGANRGIGLDRGSADRSVQAPDDERTQQKA